MRSPCLLCSLGGHDKNNSQCAGCDERINYLLKVEAGEFGIVVPSETGQETNRLRDMMEEASSATREPPPVLRETKEVRLCEECNEKEPLSPGGRYCASCMARRANEAKKLKNRTSAPQHKKLNTKGKEKANAGRISSPIPIDFSKHPAMFNELEALAEEELRPLEWQILYMLRDSLRAREQCRG